MSVKTDIAGKKFGRLTAIEPIGKTKNRATIWACRCDCGQSVSILRSNLLNGFSQSCGCLQKELLSKRIRTHGMTDTRLYYVWRQMKDRCYRPKNSHYYCYGAKNIAVCDEWRSDFKTFYDWAMSHGYEEGLTLDRIDNDGNYCPENCRWVPYIKQMQNTSRNVYLTYDGRTLCVSEWSRIMNINKATLESRIKKGWDLERALTTPPRKLNRKK